jgi:hypothetical protein
LDWKEGWTFIQRRRRSMQEMAPRWNLYSPFVSRSKGIPGGGSNCSFFCPPSLPSSFIHLSLSHVPTSQPRYSQSQIPTQSIPNSHLITLTHTTLLPLPPPLPPTLSLHLLRLIHQQNMLQPRQNPITQSRNLRRNPQLPPSSSASSLPPFLPSFERNNSQQSHLPMPQY